MICSQPRNQRKNQKYQPPAISIKGCKCKGPPLLRCIKTLDFEEVVQAICDSITATGATTIRVPGGKNARGSWFEGDGNGDAKFPLPGVDNPPNKAGEPNHMQVYVEAAKRCGIGIWATLHTYMDKPQILEYYGWLLSTGVKIDGFSLANELYAPEYYEFKDVKDDPTTEEDEQMKAEVLRFPIMIDALREAGFDGLIAIPVIVGLGKRSREKRAKLYADYVASVFPTYPKDVILDIHPYFAPDDFSEKTPKEYLDFFFAQVEESYGTGNRFVLTEWSKKNQYEFPADIRNRVIQDYIEYFEDHEEIIACYYNTMRADDKRANNDKGLYRFRTKELTEQGKFFASA